MARMVNDHSEISVWDLTDERRFGPLSLSNIASTLPFSHDCTALAWPFGMWRYRSKFTPNTILAKNERWPSPNAQDIAIDGGGELVVANAHSTQLTIRTYPAKRVEYLARIVNLKSVSLSQDATRAAVLTKNRLTIRELPTSKEIRAFAAPAGSEHVAISQTGLYAASAAGGDITVWDVTKGQIVTSFSYFPGRISLPESVHVAFAPDVPQLLSWRSFGESTEYRLWPFLPQDTADEVCRRVGRTLSEKEWYELVPDVPFADPCVRVPGLDRH